jgi:hypothetical protein
VLTAVHRERDGAHGAQPIRCSLLVASCWMSGAGDGGLELMAETADYRLRTSRRRGVQALVSCRGSLPSSTRARPERFPGADERQDAFVSANEHDDRLSRADGPVIGAHQNERRVPCPARKQAPVETGRPQACDQAQQPIASAFDDSLVSED